MSTYYVDPAATGLNNGTSWTNAWTSLQSAANTAVAGDIVYCRGEQDISAAINFNINSGANGSGWIKFIGCNASGTVDGTRFVIDALSHNTHYGVNVAVNLIWFQNIEVKNTGASYSGFYKSANGHGTVFINCSAHGCYYGWSFSGTSYCSWIRCVAYSNTGGFADDGSLNLHFACNAHDNTGNGFTYCPNILACLSYDNGGDGYSNVAYAQIINSVAEDNDDGIFIQAHTSNYVAKFLGCRFTNQNNAAGDYGLDDNNENCIVGWCYFEDNTTNYRGGTGFNYVPDNSNATTNDADKANTNEGYTSLTDGAEDFNLRSDATLRRAAVTIPLI